MNEPKFSSLEAAPAAAPLLLPAPKPPTPRPLAHRLVFMFAGPSTWEEWDRCFHYRPDLQVLVRRVERVIAEKEEGRQA